MTTSEYLKTPETVLPRELAYGELRVADSPSASHQRVVVELTLALVPFVRERQLGEVLIAPMDVVLDYEGALVVQPDVLFVSRSQSRIVSDRVYGAPDLVLEVLSPRPRIGRLDEKVTWYARYGVRECWLLDLERKSVAVLNMADGGVRARSICHGSEMVPTEVLAGLPLTAEKIFGW
jgi:Uma2 family endonuclease